MFKSTRLKTSSSLSFWREVICRLLWFRRRVTLGKTVQSDIKSLKAFRNTTSPSSFRHPNMFNAMSDLTISREVIPCRDIPSAGDLDSFPQHFQTLLQSISFFFILRIFVFVKVMFYLIVSNHQHAIIDRKANHLFL